MTDKDKIDVETFVRLMLEALKMIWDGMSEDEKTDYIRQAVSEGLGVKPEQIEFEENSDTERGD